MLYHVLQDFDGTIDNRPHDKYVAGTKVKLTEFLAHHAIDHGFVRPVQDEDLAKQAEATTIDNKAVITDGKERPVLGLRRK